MLSAFLATIWSRISGYAVAIAAALAILFGAYQRGRSDAAQRQTADRLNELNKARKIEHEVDRRSGDDRRRDLDKWLRD